MERTKSLKAPTVSIIVTARNYSKYLTECLESCLNQTHKAMEVIYSDDFSTDDSVAVAGKIKGVKVIKQIEHIGVVRARNAGADASSGEALIFVDGDDTLPPDFIEQHTQALTPNTPFVYCAAQAFGARSVLWPVREWGELFLWHQNFVNTSCMMNRWAFEKAGKWMETCANTMWDWSMAIRMSRLGTPKKSNAVLNYRQHPESYSESHEKGAVDGIAEVNLKIRRCMVRMSIGLVYSGRMEELMPHWLDKLIEDVAWLGEPPELIIVNNSGRRIDWLNSNNTQWFSKVKILPRVYMQEYTSERERRVAVATLLADSSNAILKHCTGELIHFREDDIIPIGDGFQQCFNFITDITNNKKRAAVGGLYMNRHAPCIVGGIYNRENPWQTKDYLLKDVQGEAPVQVDFTGTGFLMYWRELCPQQFYPMVNNIPAHDWKFGYDLREMGRTMWILPTARCKHYQSVEFTCVTPAEGVVINPTNHSVKSRI